MVTWDPLSFVSHTVAPLPATGRGFSSVAPASMESASIPAFV